MKGKTGVVNVLFLVFLWFGLVAPFTIGAEEKGVITLPQTGQTKSYGIDDDGKLHKGAAWPKPRFTDNNDETMTDNLTGLMWSKDARNPGPSQCTPGQNKEWKGALSHVACLNANKYLGYKDWRLPNVNELDSLINDDQANSTIWLAAQGFRNVMVAFYWSSTTDKRRPNMAWVTVMYSGNVFTREKQSPKYPVWPVRGGINISSAAVTLPQTGQTTCYVSVLSTSQGIPSSSANVIPCQGTGQDGELQTGVVWPSPRFSVAEGCVTDYLTGLTWIKNPDESRRTWDQALAFSNDLSRCGHTDWRLPNRNELRSLVNYGQTEPAKWLNEQGFSRVLADDYWTSTAYEDRPDNSWVVNLNYGHVVAGRKDKKYYVLPVRGGQ